MYSLILSTLLSWSTPLSGNVSHSIVAIEVKDLATCKAIGDQLVKEYTNSRSGFLIKADVSAKYKCIKTK